jgi:hypothetical protein
VRLILSKKIQIPCLQPTNGKSAWMESRKIATMTYALLLLPAWPPLPAVSSDLAI